MMRVSSGAWGSPCNNNTRRKPGARNPQPQHPPPKTNKNKHVKLQQPHERHNDHHLEVRHQDQDPPHLFTTFFSCILLIRNIFVCLISIMHRPSPHHRVPSFPLIITMHYHHHHHHHHHLNSPRLYHLRSSRGHHHHHHRSTHSTTSP